MILVDHQVPAMIIAVSETQALRRQNLAERLKTVPYLAQGGFGKGDSLQSANVMLQHEIELPHQFLHVEAQMVGRAIGANMLRGAVLQAHDQLDSLTVIAFDLFFAGRLSLCFQSHVAAVLKKQQTVPPEFSGQGFREILKQTEIAADQFSLRLAGGIQEV